MREVAVIGVGMHKFGRFPDKSVMRLGREAVLDALKDANMEIKDIQVAYSGNSGLGGMLGQLIFKQLGMTGIPIANVQNACATGSTAFREAYFAIATGRYDVGLAVGTEQMGKMPLLGAGGGGGMSGAGAARERMTLTEGILGTNLMPGVFAMAGMEHMREHGTTVEQFAKVSVKNHKHGYYNPNSQYQTMLTLEEVLNSRIICYPNTVMMCCPTGDGAAAAILCSMEKAQKYTTKPIRIAASSLLSDPYTQRDLALPDVNTVTRNAASEAYQLAGLGPKDLDFIELHDCFATAELLHYENLGLCAEGESGRMIDEGKTEIGGGIPVNPSGGLLAKGHPIGATGLAQICELVWQLRGQAGQRQIEAARVGLAHCVGLGTAATVHILTS